jgi:hypothetical protein
MFVYPEKNWVHLADAQRKEVGKVIKKPSFTVPELAEHGRLEEIIQGMSLAECLLKNPQGNPGKPDTPPYDAHCLLSAS